MDILIFIGQALAIAAIGYIVAKAYEYTAKYGDPANWQPTNASIPTVAAPSDLRMEQTAVHLSFVPESVGGAANLGAVEREDSGRCSRDADERVVRARAQAAPAVASRAA
jgi:hypothetical protein